MRNRLVGMTTNVPDCSYTSAILSTRQGSSAVLLSFLSVSCDNWTNMRDSTITTRADVYTEDIPGTSDGVMISSDSIPLSQASIPLVDYDVPDEGHPGKISPTSSTTPVATQPLTNDDVDTETIENAVPIVEKVLPSPETLPKIQRNGVSLESKKPVGQLEDDSCVVDCIYFAQQCCECAIV